MLDRITQHDQNEEILISQAMSSAGGKIFDELRSLNYCTAEQAAEEVFRAMERAKSPPAVR